MSNLHRASAVAPRGLALGAPCRIASTGRPIVSRMPLASAALPWGLAVGALLLAASPAAAQACTATQQFNPAREVLSCPDGLVITVEAGATYRLLDENRDGKPEGLELAGRGILIELPPGRARSRFQIYTPHAIASVRGTIWATDVVPERTSVFVVRGAVGVRSQAGRRAVTLRAGDGVDVAAGTIVPEVKRWAAERAAALLARFGR